MHGRILYDFCRKIGPASVKSRMVTGRTGRTDERCSGCFAFGLPGVWETAEILFQIHDYIDGIYIDFPDQKKDVEVVETGQQLSLFDFMGEGVPEEVPQEVSEKSKEDIEVIPEKETVSVPESEKPEIEKQEPGQLETMLTEEEQDAVYTAIEEQIREAMERTGVSFDVFSPEQMDVIYEAAEQGRDVTVVLNPDFSPEQMQLILDVLERLEMDNQAAVKRELEHLTTQVMSLDTINTIRQYYHIPLEPEKLCRK